MTVETRMSSAAGERL